MTERIASCACGRLSIVCANDPLMVSLCHCRACQRRTGSAFGIAAFFRRDAVTPSGPARSYTRPSDSGFTVTFHFCPDCGSSVYWLPERKPDLVGVAVGAFADPAFPAPSQAVHGESGHPWVTLAT